VAANYSPYCYRTALNALYLLINPATVSDDCVLLYTEADFERIQNVLPWDKRLPVRRPQLETFTFVEQLLG